MRFMTYAVAAGLVAVVAPAPAQAMLTDRESIAEVQILLRHLGYEPGVIDGLQGPLLSSAIRAFETDQGLPLTGQVDVALNARLHDVVATTASRAFVATPVVPRHGFWQRHSWPARPGGF